MNENSKRNRTLKTTTKGLIVVVVVICASAAGVVVGWKITTNLGDQPVLRRDARLDVSSDYGLRISEGDPFPDETYTTRDSVIGTFSDFFDGRPVFLLFWSFSCDGCIGQAALWNQYIQPMIHDNVRVVVCLGEYNRPYLREHEDMLSHKDVVFVDIGKFIAEYNLAAIPSIVAVDGNGLFIHAQYGHSNAFHEEFYKLIRSTES